MSNTLEFSLNKESPLQAYTEKDGMKVSLEKGRQSVFVTAIFAFTPDTISRAAELCNQLLNALSFQRRVHLEVETGAYTISGTQGIVICPRKGTSHGKGNRCAICCGNANDNIDPDVIGQVDINNSQASFYYRYAHFTNHPFIKFENLYRTIENIAHRIQLKISLDDNTSTSKYIGNSYEKSLHYLALEKCNKVDNKQLYQQAKNRLPGLNNDQSMITTITNFIYEDYRNKITHSKTAKYPFNPLKGEDIEQVRKVLLLMDFIDRSLLQYEEDKLL